MQVFVTTFLFVQHIDPKTSTRIYIHSKSLLFFIQELHFTIIFFHIDPFHVFVLPLDVIDRLYSHNVALSGVLLLGREVDLVVRNIGFGFVLLTTQNKTRNN